VHPEPEAGIAPGLEHGTRFVAVEGVRARRLAEDVDPAGLGGAGREHLAGDQLDVGGALRAGAPRGPRGTWSRRCIPGPAATAALVDHGEAVATLDLGGGGPLAPQFRHAAGQERTEHLVARRARGVDRRGDAAAVVGHARHAASELGRPVTGKDQVGVGVDESRHDRPPADVDPLVGRRHRQRPPRPTRSRCRPRQQRHLGGYRGACRRRSAGRSSRAPRCR